MISTNNSTEVMQNFDQVLDGMIQEPKLILELELHTQGNPDFKITVNDQVYYDQCITVDKESIKIEHEYNTNDISIDMLFYGKSDADTRVDEQGNIISDKNILIDRMVINNFELYSQHHIENSFIFDKIKYYDAQEQELVNGNKMGFWLNNHKLNITYPTPFYKWFLKDNSKPSYTRNMDFIRQDDNIEQYVQDAAQEAFDVLKLLK